MRLGVDAKMKQIVDRVTRSSCRYSFLRCSSVKRRHGLARCRYRGADGMKRWVGLGIIADNLINMGRWLVSQPA